MIIIVSFFFCGGRRWGWGQSLTLTLCRSIQTQKIGPCRSNKLGQFSVHMRLNHDKTKGQGTEYWLLIWGLVYRGSFPYILLLLLLCTIQFQNSQLPPGGGEKGRNERKAKGQNIGCSYEVCISRLFSLYFIIIIIIIMYHSIPKQPARPRGGIPRAFDWSLVSTVVDPKWGSQLGIWLPR